MKSGITFIVLWAVFIALIVADWYTYQHGLYLWFGASMFFTGIGCFIAGLAIHAFISASISWKK